VNEYLVATSSYTRVESVSADGTLVATTTSNGRTATIDLLDLAHGTRRRVVGKFSAAGGPTSVELSRDGRSLLYYRRGPVVVRLADGRATRIATRPELGPAELLRDGRVAYVSRGGQLMLVRPGRRPVGTRLWLPGRPVNFSISPEGRRVVYIDPRRRVWLLDRTTGRRRRLPPGLEPGPFSPDGRLVALTRPVDSNDGPGIDVVLYRVDGKRIGSLIGNRTWAEFTTPAWSVDGRWLTMPLQYSGWRPPPPYILAYSAATGRVSRLLGSAGWFGNLVVGPNGQVVLGRDVTRGAVPRTVVMVGRLTD
jgi:Tol biopolymer transport system component